MSKKLKHCLVFVYFFAALSPCLAKAAEIEECENLQSLPTEITLEVMSYLNLEDLTQVMATNSKNFAVGTLDTRWKEGCVKTILRQLVQLQRQGIKFKELGERAQNELQSLSKIEFPKTYWRDLSILFAKLSSSPDEFMERVDPPIDPLIALNSVDISQIFENSEYKMTMALWTIITLVQMQIHSFHNSISRSAPGITPELSIFLANSAAILIDTPILIVFGTFYIVMMPYAFARQLGEETYTKYTHQLIINYHKNIFENLEDKMNTAGMSNCAQIFRLSLANKVFE